MKIKIRNSTFEDIPRLLEIEKLAGWDEDSSFNENQLQSQISTFSMGHLVAEISDQIEGYVVVFVIEYHHKDNFPSWYKITNNGMITNHNPYLAKKPNNNTVLYGANLSVSKDAPKGVSDKLMDSVAALAVKLGIKRVVLGARIPFYGQYKKKHPTTSATEYVKLTRNNHALDPELFFYQRTAGVKILGLANNYFKDQDSLDYGVIIEWKNPLYNNLILKNIPFLRKIISKFISAN